MYDTRAVHFDFFQWFLFRYGTWHSNWAKLNLWRRNVHQILVSMHSNSVDDSNEIPTKWHLSVSIENVYEFDPPQKVEKVEIQKNIIENESNWKKLKQKGDKKLPQNYNWITRFSRKGFEKKILIVIRRNVCPLLLSSFAQRSFITVEHGARERT